MNQEDKLIRLTQNHPIKPFDCGDQSLNKFLFKEAKLSQTKLLSITYLLENETDTIAFFSLSNDKIGINEFGGTNLQKLRKKLGKPIEKTYKSYPSVKIGRLAVNVKYERKNVGTSLLDYLKVLFVTENRTGCAFITVDAYGQSLGFYEKNGFDYLTKNDENLATRLLFYDLQQLVSFQQVS